MSTVTELGIALTAVFAVSLGALVAQIAWVLWRRNRLLRNDGGSGRGDIERGDASGGRTSKELLYFCCCRKDSQSLTRVEPSGRHGDHGPVMGDGLEEGDEVMKWHKMYRESMMLCTIKEEEKEGESDRDGDGSGGGLAAAETEEKKKTKERRVCLREWLEAKQESLDRDTAIVIMSALEELSSTELMRFSTPCGSPDRYFTPSPSPAREEQDDADETWAKMAGRC